jgi:1-acyl-sn-glycerol-3-phosphate acyltransferase
MEYRAVLHNTSPEEYQFLRRFDMKKPPHRQWHVLRPVTWLLSFPDVWSHQLKIHRDSGLDLRGPFILLSNHMAFLDFKVATAALFPRRSNYVVAIDGFIGRENLLRFAGGIMKRRLTSDIHLIRHMHHIIHRNGDVLTIYPEGRYSLIGTEARLPDSLAKLLKSTRVPVVMLRMNGNFLDSPVWNLKRRGNPIEARIWNLFTREDLERMQVSAIKERLKEAFHYDDYQWQKDNGIHINSPFRAEGLHRVLYRCPACETDFSMTSAGSGLECRACGKRWTMGSLGQLQAETGETEFPHPPDWYDYQVKTVREELSTGKYHFEDEVRVESLANSKGYYNLKTARVTHDLRGFTLKGDPAYFPDTVRKTPQSMYSCHIEFDYFGKGDCFEISTMSETWYLYPLNIQNAVTKILIATEEMHRMAKA